MAAQDLCEGQGPGVCWLQHEAPIQTDGAVKRAGHEHGFWCHKPWVQMLGLPFPHCAAVHSNLSGPLCSTVKSK